VTLTNAGGTSNVGAVTVQSVAPAFFTTNGYVAAIPAGNVLQLYGTGFGATSPGVAAGAVFNGSAAALNAVTASIGGQPADVLWAGLVGAGLYQVNVAVPQGMSGDREVVATVAGMSTAAGLVRV
jgi:uncharacterized protein (TIGR03437 family)